MVVTNLFKMLIELVLPLIHATSGTDNQSETAAKLFSDVHGSINGGQRLSKPDVVSEDATAKGRKGCEMLATTPYRIEGCASIDNH